MTNEIVFQFESDLSMFLSIGIITLLSMAIAGSIILVTYYSLIIHYCYIYKPRKNAFTSICKKHNIIAICNDDPSCLAYIQEPYSSYNIVFYGPDVENFSREWQEMTFWHEYKHLQGTHSEKDVWEFSKKKIVSKYGTEMLKKILWEDIMKVELKGYKCKPENNVSGNIIYKEIIDPKYVKTGGSAEGGA